MATSNEIKGEMQFFIELRQLLEVMKDIAVIQFRILQDKKQRFTRWTHLVQGFFDMLGESGQVNHPFIKPSVEKECIVMVTSDEGFMGGLNLQVIDAGIRQTKSADTKYVIIGERGAVYLKDIGKKFTLFKGAGDYKERVNLAMELKNIVTKGVLSQEFGYVDIFYPLPVSFMVQRVDVLRLLPTYTISKESKNANKEEIVIIESAPEGIVEYLVEELIVQKFIEVLEDSKLSEYAARAMHLEESRNELIDKEKALRFQYFRAYHEIIDRSTRESFSAQIIKRKERKRKTEELYV